MMKTLRRKFVLFAMLAVSVLLIVLIGAINGFSWMILNRQSDSVLHTLASEEDRLFQMEPRDPKRFLQPMDIDTIRSARFFTVRLAPDGNVLEVNIDQISSVSVEQAEQYAVQVKNTTGKIENYKYEVKQRGGDRVIFFMDTSGQVRMFVMVLSISTAIAVVCWLVILLFVMLLSGRIVRPILAGMEKQKQFITNAGHELKTPLAIIQSNNDAATLIYGESKYSNHIRQQTQRLNVLMTNLLTLARLDEDMKPPTEPVNVSEAIGSMLGNYEGLSAQKEITLETEIQPALQMQVNREMFLQMISILLDNAVKYTPQGGEIRFSAKGDSGHIVITEENTCEMPHNANPEQLFERFYRGDSARTQSSPVAGYGIGLSAARSIVETFGGKLTAAYPENGRIRFVARFSRKQ